MVINKAAAAKLSLDLSKTYPIGHYVICLDNKGCKKYLTVGNTYVLTDPIEEGDLFASVRCNNGGIIIVPNKKFASADQLNNNE